LLVHGVSEATLPDSSATQTSPSSVTVIPWGSPAGAGRSQVDVAPSRDVSDPVRAPLGEPASAFRSRGDRGGPRVAFWKGKLSDVAVLGEAADLARVDLHEPHSSIRSLGDADGTRCGGRERMERGLSIGGHATDGIGLVEGEVEGSVRTWCDE